MDIKKYDLIYADPPWHFKIWSKKGNSRSASNHYQTQDLAYLKGMNIEAISKPDCTLFMWATFPLLQQAFDLAASWGFTYKTVAFTWIKKNRKTDSLFMGMGYYTRANAEIVLLFTKGKPLKRYAKSIPQVIMSPVSRHSEKPSEVRSRIEKLFGEVDRLELFARRSLLVPHDVQFRGWDVYGNEVENSIVLPD